MATAYDVVVIGSGPAGEAGALHAAAAGKRVAIVERADIGGSGINTGALPAKLLRETALSLWGLRRRALIGLDVRLREDLVLDDLMGRQSEVTERELELTYRSFAELRVSVVRGDASFLDPNTIRVFTVDGLYLDLAAEAVLIATGSSPSQLPALPVDGDIVHNSATLLQQERVPRSLLVVGADIIGCEYAALFAILGTTVTLVDRRRRLLRFVDWEIADRLRAQIEAEGVVLRLGHWPDAFEVDESGVTAVLDDGRRVHAEQALSAVGRRCNTDRLGLGAIGVETEPWGAVRVNRWYQSTMPHVYAAGDVIGFPAMASVAVEQARAAMDHAFGLRRVPLPGVLPTAVYTIPEIASVGRTEEQCLEDRVPFVVGRASYAANARGRIIGDREGMLKLLFSPHDRRLLGAHHIGELSAELVHVGAQAMASGATIDALASAVYNYPTLASIYRDAAADGLARLAEWGRERAPVRG